MYGFSRQDNGQSGVTDLEIFSQNPTRSIFVRDLPYFCCSSDLTKFFYEQMHVPILHAVVCKNKKRRTLQFGCVMFESEDHVNLAIEIMNGKRFVGRDIRVMRYDTNSPLEASSTGLIHVSFKALSAQCPLVTEAVLRDSFEAYGDIEHVSIRSHKYSEAGMQGGYGFLTFLTPEQNKLVVDRVRQTIINDILYDCSWSESHTQKVLGAEASVDFRLQESKFLGGRPTTRSIGAMGGTNAGGIHSLPLQHSALHTQHHNRASMHDPASVNGLSPYSDPRLLAAGRGGPRSAGDYLRSNEHNRYPQANHFAPNHGQASRHPHLSSFPSHYNDERNYLPYDYSSHRGLPSPSTASSSISNYSSLSSSSGVGGGLDGRLRNLPRSAMPPLPPSGRYEDPITLRQLHHHHHQQQQQLRYFNEDPLFPSASNSSTSATAIAAVRQRQQQQQFALGQTDMLSRDLYYEPDYDSRMYASRVPVGGGGFARQPPSQAQEYDDLARFQLHHAGASASGGSLSSANLRGAEYEYAMSMRQQHLASSRTGGADNFYDSFSTSSSSLYPSASSSGASELDASLYGLAGRVRVFPNNNQTDHLPLSRQDEVNHQQQAKYHSASAFPREQQPLSLDEYGLPKGRAAQPLDFPSSSSSSVLAPANLHSFVSQSMSPPSLSSDFAAQLSLSSNPIQRPQQVSLPLKAIASFPSSSVAQPTNVNEFVPNHLVPRDRAGTETSQSSKPSSGLPLFFADVPANAASSFAAGLEEEELGGLDDDQHASLEGQVENNGFDVTDYDDPSIETVLGASDN